MKLSLEQTSLGSWKQRKVLSELVANNHFSRRGKRMYCQILLIILLVYYQRDMTLKKCNLMKQFPRPCFAWIRQLKIFIPLIKRHNHWKRNQVLSSKEVLRAFWSSKILSFFSSLIIAFSGKYLTLISTQESYFQNNVMQGQVTE